MIISFAKDVPTSDRIQFLGKIESCLPGRRPRAVHKLDPVEYIVSNKHRRAYGKTAQVLGSLAEAHTAMGQNNDIIKILYRYNNEKFNRFSAFRNEVNAVVKNSILLKIPGF